MLFSILVAHYNNYHYFLDCYKSIIQQTHQNFEVILVDDCSTDSSFGKIKELVKNDSRFKLYQNNENKGVGFTKKRCVDMASGEICGFLDPDDAIVENALLFSIENYGKDTIATYSNFFLCDSQLKILHNFPHSRPVINKNKYFFNIFLEVSHFFTFKKEAYDKTYGIDPTLTSAVDQDLYLKLYELGNFKFIKLPLYYYRLHGKGVSQESSKKEKLNLNWHQVILDSLKRRNIDTLYHRKVADIEYLPDFLREKQNTIFAKILRKLS